MLSILLLAAASVGSSWVQGVPDMVTAEICFAATDGHPGYDPRGPIFSREAFDARARTYRLLSVERSNELIFCLEYVRTVRLLVASQSRISPR
jgi:hypothetical protein